MLALATTRNLVTRDGPNRRLFLHAKNNLAAPPQGLAFTLEQSIIGDTGIVASRIVWETEPVDISADAAMAASQQMKRNVVYVLTTLKTAPIRSRR